MKTFLIQVPDLIKIRLHRRAPVETRVVTAQDIKDALSWCSDYDDPELGFEERGGITVIAQPEPPDRFKRAVISKKRG